MYPSPFADDQVETTGHGDAGHLADPQSDANSGPSISHVDVNVTSPDLDFLGGRLRYGCGRDYRKRRAHVTALMYKHSEEFDPQTALVRMKTGIMRSVAGWGGIGVESGVLPNELCPGQGAPRMAEQSSKLDAVDAAPVFKCVNVNKCTKAGGKFIFWVAESRRSPEEVPDSRFTVFSEFIEYSLLVDFVSVWGTQGHYDQWPAKEDWFALMNDKMGGDIDKIRMVGDPGVGRLRSWLFGLMGAGQGCNVVKDVSSCLPAVPEEEAPYLGAADLDEEASAKMEAHPEGASSSRSWPASPGTKRFESTLQGATYWANYWLREAQEIRELTHSGEDLFYKRKYVFKTGASYDGEWMGAERNGRGIQGCWSNNMASGMGMFLHSNGAVYYGQWRYNQAHGLGVYRDADGATYAGEWAADQPDGYGEETWPDTSRYRGSFKKGAKHGRGDVYNYKVCTPSCGEHTIEGV
ncbi:Phosphatidylinositol 4-phosphate 5-kinase 1 [Symbiodinium microadriaticum]|uniref:Phosphatidylinositol 4-phosphate 5-kinase 1 n=1 Tax=Symbiodinium microadriaticum TaxID=2951 RepID=A0A1Q9CI69_SYMMI|nr:Phosphatidylinositol 4-phosphate 5-kinase 1 [Symbiodinium microadriaticum]